MKNRPKYEALLLEALDHPIGIKVPSESADKLRRNLYVARRELSDEGDSSYDNLSLSISPHDENTLFIYKKDWKLCLEASEKNDP